MISLNSIKQKRRLIPQCKKYEIRLKKDSAIAKTELGLDFTCLRTVACSNVQLHLVNPGPALRMISL